MTSIKKYLGQEKEDITSWLARIVILLLEGIALHAVEHETEAATFLDTDDLATFGDPLFDLDEE